MQTKESLEVWKFDIDCIIIYYLIKCKTQSIESPLT